MAKKKAAPPEHVTLSKEAVAKLLSHNGNLRSDGAGQLPGPEVIVLAPFDMLALERAEAQAAAAQTRVHIARLEKQVITLTRQLQDIDANHRLDEVATTSRAAGEAHRKLADDVAARYGFSWKTHSYQPETGEVTAADPES